MAALTEPSFTAILKHRFGPHDQAEGTYAQVCALVESGRRDWHPDYSDKARRFGCKVRRVDPIPEMLYAEMPFFQMLTKGRITPRPPPPMREWDVWRTQEGKHGSPR